MKIAESHVAFVRGLVWDVVDETEMVRLTDVVQQEGRESEQVLEIFVQMVFIHAARKHFEAEATHADVIRYVAKARSTGFLQGEEIDIRVPERLLRGALGDTAAKEGLNEYDSIILAPLTADLIQNELKLDEAGFRKLLADSREDTEQLAARLWS